MLLRSLLILAFVASVPHVARAEDPIVVVVPHSALDLDAPPPQHRRVASTFVLVGGAALFGIGYATNAIAGYGAGYYCVSTGGGYFFPTSTCQHDERWSSFRDWSYVPILGPFAQLSMMPPGARSGAWPALLVATGIAQSAGLGLLIAGLVMKLGEAAAAPADDTGFSLVPSVTATEAGVIATGRF